VTTRLQGKPCRERDCVQGFCRAARQSLLRYAKPTGGIFPVAASCVLQNPMANRGLRNRPGPDDLDRQRSRLGRQICPAHYRAPQSFSEGCSACSKPAAETFSSRDHELPFCGKNLSMNMMRPAATTFEATSRSAMTASGWTPPLSGPG